MIRSRQERIREETFIPPSAGRVAVRRPGEALIIIDVEGKHVGDFVCFDTNNTEEYVSPVHRSASLIIIRLQIGDGLYSNKRRPLMTCVEDTVGKHDFFFPACDYYRYKVDYNLEDHPNCHDNLKQALTSQGLGHVHVPDPINFFMNNALDNEGDYIIEEPWSKPGDYVRLRAEEEVIIACSTCSQDLAPVNGWKVTPIKMQIVEAR